MIVGKDGNPPIEVDPEREELDPKQRVQEIICAVRLLQREGLGDRTPDQICIAVTKGFLKQLQPNSVFLTKY